MTTFEWRKEFETGNAQVDHEHSELVQLLKQVMDAISDGQPTDKTLDLLGEVNARISGHFALEEAEMRRCHYDDYEDHKEDHERLLDDIRDLMEAFENGSYVNAVDDFSVRLHAWFVDHFKTKDARLHRVMSPDDTNTG